MTEETLVPDNRLLNKFLVGVLGITVRVFKPPMPHKCLSREDALNLAAWLVAMSGATEEEFLKVRAKITS